MKKLHTALIRLNVPLIAFTLGYLYCFALFLLCVNVLA